MMRRLLLAACLASTLALADDPDGWTPDRDTVAKVDALAMTYALPEEFGPITAYARYYRGAAIGGQRIIVGALISPRVRKEDSGTVHVVSGEVPAYADGGCMFIYLMYDPQAGKMLHIACNGEVFPPKK